MLWASGALGMAPVGLLGTLSTRAIQMPVILLVRRKRPVCDWFMFSRTASLHRRSPEIVLYIFELDWDSQLIDCVGTVNMSPAASDSQFVNPVCNSAPVSSDSRYLVTAGFWCQPVSQDSRFVIPVGASVPVSTTGYLGTAGL